MSENNNTYVKKNNSTNNVPEVFILNSENNYVIFMVCVNKVKSMTNKFDSLIHTHSSFELQCILKNSAELCLDNKKTFLLHEDDILLIPPHMLHDDHTPSTEFSRRTINFYIVPCLNHSKNDKITPTFHEKLFSCINQEVIFKNKEIIHCIRQLYTLDFTDPNAYVTSKAKAYLTLIFEEITNHLTTLFPHIETKYRSISSSLHIQTQRKWLIDAYLSEYYMTNNHVSNLAHLLNVSTRQVNRIVKELTNRPLQEQILEQRMNVAVKHIHKKTLPLYRIAELVGYNTYSGFYTAFCNFFGYPPETLRNET